MIKNAGKFISILFILAISAIGTMAQYGSYNTSDREIINTISRIQNNSARMRSDLNNSRSQASTNVYSERNRLNTLLLDFQNQTSNLSSRVQQRRASSSDAQNVLSKANQ